MSKHNKLQPTHTTEQILTPPVRPGDALGTGGDLVDAASIPLEPEASMVPAITQYRQDEEAAAAARAADSQRRQDESQAAQARREANAPKEKAIVDAERRLLAARAEVKAAEMNLREARAGLPGTRRFVVTETIKGISVQSNVTTLNKGKVISEQYYGGAAGIAKLRDAGAKLELLE